MPTDVRYRSALTAAASEMDGAEEYRNRDVVSAKDALPPELRRCAGDVPFSQVEPFLGWL